MAQINFQNPQWGNNPPINNTAKYTSEEIERHRKMDINDFFTDSFRLFGDSPFCSICRFCGAPATMTGYPCGYAATATDVNGNRRLITLCRNFHTRVIGNKIEQEFKGTFGTVVSSHACSCHIVQLMKTGCICGGV